MRTMRDGGWPATQRALGLLTVVLLVAACHAGGSPSPQPLDGRTFLSASVSEGGKARVLAPGTRIRIGFSSGRVTASAGCNLLGGAYRLAGGRLLVEQLATTDMGCDPARHEQDAWLATFLEGGPAVRLAGDDLSLEREATIVQLVDRRVADPDRPLVGTTWKVESIIRGASVSSVPQDVVASFLFQSDGQVRVETGCNAGGGSYVVDGTSLRLSAVALTKRACSGPAGELERAVVALLGAEGVGFVIEASALTLSAGDRGLGLRAS
jgi:heat shock protein HslJ